VHGGEIVPQHEVADAPALIPGVPRRGRVRPQPVEQGVALLERDAVNIGIAAPTEIEQRPAGGGAALADGRRPARGADR